MRCTSGPTRSPRWPSGCVVAHCPRSNALLGCGAAPLRELREAGVPVGLGTDSPASALTFDMFEEMRAAILLARTREGDPRRSGGRRARARDADGATALDRSGELGVLRGRRGCRLVAVELASTRRSGRRRPRPRYVYGGSPQRVVMTVVAGACGTVRVARNAAALSQASAARSRMLSNTT